MQATNTLTVMFCDMRGFTKLSGEDGADAAAALQELLNDVFSR